MHQMVVLLFSIRGSSSLDPYALRSASQLSIVPKWALPSFHPSSANACMIVLWFRCPRFVRVATVAVRQAAVTITTAYALTCGCLCAPRTLLDLQIGRWKAKILPVSSGLVGRLTLQPSTFSNTVVVAMHT
jgi:hypothetical protein